MEKNEKKREKSNELHSEPGSTHFEFSPADIEGKKSARTTFGLSEGAINALDWLRKKGVLTVKTTFDILSEVLLENDRLTESLAKAAAKLGNKTKKRRKTYVVSKKSLRTLNELASKYNVPRDALAETAIIFYKVALEEIIEKEKEAHGKALDIISKFCEEEEKTLEELKRVLEKDDPILVRFFMIEGIIHDLLMAIQSNLEKGTPIDPDDLAQSM